MEQWEEIINNVPPDINLNDFRKLVQNAAVVLKEDLADFEADWILQTLFYKPVHLFKNIATKRNDTTWYSVIGESFKLIAKTIPSYQKTFEQFYGDIVKLCHRSYDAQTKRSAILVLVQVAQVSRQGAEDLDKLVRNLEESATSKAPMALLVGTICEYHPSKADELYTTVWRTYLNMLSSNKNSDTIIASLLQGIGGLFVHFGDKLSTMELHQFYEKLVNDYLTIKKCQLVSIKLLSQSELFKDKLLNDARLRIYLWRILPDIKEAAPCLINIYKAIWTLLDKNRIQSTAIEEVQAHTQSPLSYVKYTALRILDSIERTTDIVFEVARPHSQTLEFKLRSESVTYDMADEISYCIESNQLNSEKLLQTALMHYNNIPEIKRKDVVLYGILNSSQEFRDPIINFLINETCQNDTSFDSYLPVWLDIFGSKCQDPTTVEKMNAVYEVFMKQVTFVLESILDEENPKPDNTNLDLQFKLTYQILTQNQSNDENIVFLALMLQYLSRHGVTAAGIAVCRAAAKRGTDELRNKLMEFVSIERCDTEALLCECCITNIELGTLVDLATLKILFSRRDVDPSILKKALVAFSGLLQSKAKLEAAEVTDIMQLIDKLRSRADWPGKDGRELRRDIIMFLGKYNTISQEYSARDTISMVELRDTLVLNVQNVHSGDTHGINLQTLLHAAYQHEHYKALESIMISICATLSSKPTASLRTALLRVVCAICASHAQAGAVDVCACAAAASMAGGLQGIVEFISTQSSPGLRRMICDTLEGVVREQRADSVAALTEAAAVMMEGNCTIKRRAGLDLALTIIEVLKENNLLTKKLLPQLIVAIIKTNQIDSKKHFDVALELLIDKIELYSSDLRVLTRGIDELIANIIDMNRFELIQNDVEMKYFWLGYKIKVKSTLELILELQKAEKIDNDFIEQVLKTILNNIGKEENFSMLLYVLTELKNSLQLESNAIKEILSQDNGYVLKKLFEDRTFENGMDLESILLFMETFSEVLLELEYQKTYQLMSDVIKGIPPQSMKEHYKDFKNCLSKYMNHGQTPTIITKSIIHRCGGLNDVTEHLKKELFNAEQAHIVNSLKLTLNAANLKDLSFLTDVKIESQKWPKILLSQYSKGNVAEYWRPHQLFLTDVLTVAVKFLTDEEVMRLVEEGSHLEGVSNEKVGVKFCSYFMNVFYGVFLKKPFLLLGERMANCTGVLNNLASYVVKRNRTEEIDALIDLVDQIWPIYESKTTFKDKHSLLLNIQALSTALSEDSNAIKWAVKMLESNDLGDDDKAKLIVVVPPGNSTSVALLRKRLPTRLADLNSAPSPYAGALLEVLANSAHPDLLSLALAIAYDEDKTETWFIPALEACMVSLISSRAERAEKTREAVFTRGLQDSTLGVCQRAVLPMIRYSTSSEQFLSKVIKEILDILGKIEKGADGFVSQKRLTDYIKSFMILQLVFEKLSPSTLESPNSLVYKSLAPQSSWHLVRVVCKLCAFLRKDITCGQPRHAELHRQFQCANYNCLCAAICCRKPPEKTYDIIYSLDVWKKIVDPTVSYKLPLKRPWQQQTKRQSTSVQVTTQLTSLTSLTSTATSRTSPVLTSQLSLRSRVFLRTLTLSDNPLQYDMTNEVDSELTNQDLNLTANALNSHECAATLTAVICHSCQMSHERWRNSVIEALTSDCHRNVKFLIAQVLVNCKEVLAPHASALRPALLAFINETIEEENGRKVLNGLQVDVLTTLLDWPEEDPQESDNLNSVTEALVSTCLLYRATKSMYTWLYSIVDKILNIYEKVVQISWNPFRDYISDFTAPTKTIELLNRVAKSQKIVAQEIPNIALQKMNTKPNTHLSELAQLFGTAMAACQTDSCHLSKFKELLEGLKRESRVTDYVKMLYFAQRECWWVCDEKIFKGVLDRTSALMGADQTKCIRILTNYITNKTNIELKQTMFRILNIPELLTKENVREVLKLVKPCLSVMDGILKSTILNQISVLCKDTVALVRKDALGVILHAFEELHSTDQSEPSAKKTKFSTSTPTLKSLGDSDTYTLTVLKCIGYGITDNNGDIRQMVIDSVGTLLFKEDLSVRFAESFLLAIYLPSISTQDSTTNLTTSLSAVIELMFSDLRTNERFRKTLLKEEPVLKSALLSSATTSKMLTASKTYQGTFKRPTLTKTRDRYKAKREVSELTSSLVDTQISVTSVLEPLLQFAMKTPQAAQAFIIQIVKSLATKSAEFHFRQIMVTQLAAILKGKVTEVTPLVLEMCRLFVDDLCKVDSFQPSIEKLKRITKNTQGEGLVDSLYEDMIVRKPDHTLFVLGHYENEDIVMGSDALEFCLEDLEATFGKLSNWDNLTIKDKRHIMADLPALWTGRDAFKRCIADYNSDTSWLSNLLESSRQLGRERAPCWLRAAERWPKEAFSMAATTEAVMNLEETFNENHLHMVKIEKKDCLAQWAARLMVRSSIIDEISDEDDDAKQDIQKLSLSHELAWCERANEMAIPSIVLQCVERNLSDITDKDLQLQWVKQKLIATRTIALQRNNETLLKEAIATAENLIPQVANSLFLDMQRLKLQLQMDTKSTTKPTISNLNETLDQYCRVRSLDSNELSNSETLGAIYKIVVCYYDQIMEEDPEVNKEEILSSMVSTIIHVSNHVVCDFNAYISVLLSRLDSFTDGQLNGAVAKMILDLISSNLKKLNQFTKEHIRSLSHLFPSRLLAKYSYMNERDDDNIVKYKKCLQLVCDAEYLLEHYCDCLLFDLKEGKEWNTIFERMREKFFENPYIGDDFKWLHKHKNTLYELQQYENTKSFLLNAEVTIMDIKNSLNLRNRDVLQLSHLCPTLLQRDVVRDKNLSVFLGLPDNVHVVKFYEKVEVMKSLRRPCVLKALVSDGRRPRWLVKGGESLRADAAARAGGRAAYAVTILGEDCGLVEYLEDHETLRALIETRCDLDSILDSVKLRRSDDEAFLDSEQASLQHFQQLCDKVPAYVLRSAIEHKSVTAEDFIRKKRAFTESIAHMTVTNWILGLGDRHLKNTMYSVATGAARTIDWGAALHYGGVELPAARLTRAVVAACDSRVLESRIQTILQGLRDDCTFFLAVLKTSFRWREDFEEKYIYMVTILKGEKLSYEITKDVIQNGSFDYKEKRMQLLDRVFEEWPKTSPYCVEDQVSSLLRHCTEPRILSVTRNNWEPWV